MISDAEELETVDEEPDFDHYQEENIDEEEDPDHRLAPGIAIVEPFFDEEQDQDYNKEEEEAKEEYPDGDMSFNISKFSDEDQHDSAGDGNFPVPYLQDGNILEAAPVPTSDTVGTRHPDPENVEVCDIDDNNDSLLERSKEDSSRHRLSASEPNPSNDLEEEKGKKPVTIWDSPDAVGSIDDDHYRAVDDSLESLNLSLTFSRHSPELMEGAVLKIGTTDSSHSQHVDSAGSDELISATSLGNNVLSDRADDDGYAAPISNTVHSIYSPMDKMPTIERLKEVDNADPSAYTMDDSNADTYIDDTLPPAVVCGHSNFADSSNNDDKPDSNYFESAKDTAESTSISNATNINISSIPDATIPTFEEPVVTSPSSFEVLAPLVALDCTSIDSNSDFSRKLRESQSEKSTPTNLITVGGDMNSFYDEFQQKFIHVSTTNTPLTPMGASRFTLHVEKKLVERPEAELENNQVSVVSLSEGLSPRRNSALGCEDINPRNLNEDMGLGKVINDGNEMRPVSDSILPKLEDSNAKKSKNATTSPSLFAPSSWIKKKNDGDEVNNDVTEMKREADISPSVLIESPGITQRRKGKRSKKKSTAGKDNESDEFQDNSDNSVAIVSDHELSSSVNDLASASVGDGTQRRESIIASVRPPNVLKKRLHGSAGQVQARRNSFDPSDQITASISRSADELTTSDPSTNEQSIQLDSKPTEGSIMSASHAKKDDIVLYEEIYKHELKTEVTISPMLKQIQKEDEMEESKGNSDLPSNDRKSLTTVSNDSDNASNKENSARNEATLSHDISKIGNKTPETGRGDSSLSPSPKDVEQAGARQTKAKRLSLSNGSHPSEPSGESKKDETFVRDSADELSESELANKPTVAEKSTFIVVPSSKPKQAVKVTTLLDLSNDSISNCVDFSQYLDSGSFKTLKVLLLRNNDLDSVDELCLGGQFANLTDLDLAYNFIVSPVSANFFPKTLLRLDLSHNKLTETSFIMVCIGLLELNLSHNRIKVVTGFPSTLRRLDLSNNRIASSLSLRLLSLSVDIQTLNIASNPILKKDPQWRLKLRSFLPKLAIIDQTVISKTLATKMQEEEQKAKMKKPVVSKELQVNSDNIRVLQHQKRLERLAQLVDKVDQEAKYTANHHKRMQPDEVVLLTQRLSRLSPSKMKVNPLHGKKNPPTENSILKPSIQAFHSSSSVGRGSPERKLQSFSQDQSANMSKSKIETKSVPTVLRDVMSNKEPRLYSPLRKRTSEGGNAKSKTGAKTNSSTELGEHRRGSGSQSTSSFPDFSNNRSSRKARMDEFKYNIREEDDEHFIPSSTVSMSSIDRSEIMIAVPSSFSLTDGISMDKSDSATEKTPSALDSYQQALYGNQEILGKRFLKYDNRKIYNKKYDLSLNDFADLLSPLQSTSDNGISGSDSHDLNNGPMTSKVETIPVAELSEDLVILSEMKDCNNSTQTSVVESVPAAPTIGTGLVAAAVNRIKRSLSITKTPLGEEQQHQQPPPPDMEKPAATGKFNLDSLAGKLKKIEQLTSAVPTLASVTSFLSRSKSSNGKSGEEEPSHGPSHERIGSGPSGFSPVPPKSRTPPNNPNFSSAAAGSIPQKTSPSEIENEKKPSLVERQMEFGFQPITADSSGPKDSKSSASAVSKTGQISLSTTALRPTPWAAELKKTQAENNKESEKVGTIDATPAPPALKPTSNHLSDSVDDNCTAKVSVKDRLLARLGKSASTPATASSVEESDSLKEDSIEMKPPKSSNSWDSAIPNERVEKSLHADIQTNSSVEIPHSTMDQPVTAMSTGKDDNDSTTAVVRTDPALQVPSMPTGIAPRIKSNSTEAATLWIPEKAAAIPLPVELEESSDAYVDTSISVSKVNVNSLESAVPAVKEVITDSPVFLEDLSSTAIASIGVDIPVLLAEPSVVPRSESHDNCDTAKMIESERTPPSTAIASIGVDIPVLLAEPSVVPRSESHDNCDTAKMIESERTPPSTAIASIGVDIPVLLAEPSVVPRSESHDNCDTAKMIESERTPPSTAIALASVDIPVLPAEPSIVSSLVRSESHDDTGTAKMSAKERILARMKKNKEAQSEK